MKKTLIAIVLFAILATSAMAGSWELKRTNGVDNGDSFVQRYFYQQGKSTGEVIITRDHSVVDRAISQGYTIQDGVYQLEATHWDLATWNSGEYNVFIRVREQRNAEADTASLIDMIQVQYP